ncbi:MAG: cellulase family glycosylhydrolase [Bacteroidales bacterium]|nr:cellulase family glycosylhydrolase [Bacteroidales bacterium]
MKKFCFSLLAMLFALTASALTTKTIWSGEFYSDKQSKSGVWKSWQQILTLEAHRFIDVIEGDVITFYTNARVPGETVNIQIADMSWDSYLAYDVEGDNYAAIHNGKYELKVTSANVNAVKGGLNIKGENFILTRIDLTTSGNGGGDVDIAEGSFHVSGTKILDANNKEFMMRGCNYSWTWQRGHEQSVIPAAKRIGCNIIRIQLGDGKQYYEPSKDELEYLITLCERNKLVAMFNTHDETGSNSLDDLKRAANFWIKMKDVLNAHLSTVIVNISNEWYGSWNNAQAWADGYKTVIPMIRNAGIKNMLVVDAAGYGQWPTSIFSKGKEVAATDKLKNTVFSIHFYDSAGDTDSKVRSNIDNALNIGYPVIVGEFAYKHRGNDVAWQTILDYCAEKRVGYLVWSWTGNGSGTEDCDMFGGYDDSDYRPNGTYTVKGRNGIKETSTECSVFDKNVNPDPEPGPEPEPGPGPDPDDDSFEVVGTYTFQPSEPLGSWKNEVRIPESAFVSVNEKSKVRILFDNEGQLQLAVKKNPDYEWYQINDYADVFGGQYEFKIADVPSMGQDAEIPVVVDALKFFGLTIKGKDAVITGCQVLNPKGSGVSDIVAADEAIDWNAPVEIYTVTGLRVAEMTPGAIYIVRQGAKVAKIVK